MSNHEVPRWLNISTTAAIAANFAAFGWGLVDKRHHEMAERAEDITLVFFACEMALRLKIQGRLFWRSGWNVTDMAIIVVAVLPLLAEMLHRPIEGLFGSAVAVTVLRLVRGVKLVHMLRHGAHFRVVSRYEAWRFYRGFSPVTEEEWGSPFAAA
jgi:hypothetical protein